MSISLDTNWDPEEKWNDGINEILSKVDLFLPNENEVKSIMGESEYRNSTEKGVFCRKKLRCKMWRKRGRMHR